MAPDVDHAFTFLVFGDRAPLDLAGYPGRDAWLLRRGTQGAVDARQDGLGMFRAAPVDYFHELPDRDAPAASGGSSSEDALPAHFGLVARTDSPAYSQVVRIEDVPPRTFGRGAYTRASVQLGPRVDATRLDIHLDTIAPGHVDSPLHHHLGDEECFYVLAGTARLRLAGPGTDGPHDVALRAGDCISFPAATGIAHQIRVPDDAPEPLRLLILATRATVDVVHLVDSKKWILKRADLDREAMRTWGSAIVRDERVGWLDGEPLLDEPPRQDVGSVTGRGQNRATND